MKPLEGIRVLELARILAGPWAGQLLADLGADVVKVERPGEGDDTRAWGPPFLQAADGTSLSSAYYHSCNRGKRSVAIDFETAEGQAAVRALAARADVLIENFKLGGLAKYGLDWESLRGVNPRLVYCSITGFGQTGPYAARAGYDYIIQAMAGMMDLTGEPDREPQKVGIACADIWTGVYSTVAILAALQRRHATGLGGHVDMALMDTQVAVLAGPALSYFASGKVPTRMGNGHPQVVPYQVFPVADGHMVVATGNDGQYRRFCAVLGAPELGRDPRFLTNADRVTRRAELIPLLSALTLKKERAQLLAALEDVGVPAGPINSIAEAHADPQVLARGLRIDFEAPEAAAGTIPSVRSPIVIDGEPMRGARPSPRLGEHSGDLAGLWS